MKKLNLKKKVVSVLTDEETKNVKGGAFTTSYTGCTGALCCDPKGCPTNGCISKLLRCDIIVAE